MATHDEVAAIFGKMQERFDPKKAEGMNATIQFQLAGDNGGPFWVRIADGKLDTGSGNAENPKMTLLASADDFYSMMTGSLNAMNAFMTGKVKIQGDTGLALKLMPLIG